jgi:hypothetical protein
MRQIDRSFLTVDPPVRTIRQYEPKSLVNLQAVFKFADLVNL